MVEKETETNIETNRETKEEANKNSWLGELLWRPTVTGEMPWKGGAREEAFYLLHKRILNLDLKPGAPLRDKDLAEELQMSRTPVREAILLLLSTNLVFLRPQVGTFVAFLDPERIEMEQFARCCMEKEILLRCCGKLSEEQKGWYRENLSLFQEAISLQEPERSQALLILDNEFHRIAFRVAGRERYFEKILYQMQHIERLRRLCLVDTDPLQILQEHEKIMEALEMGEFTPAIYWMERNLWRYREELPALKKKYADYFL